MTCLYVKVPFSRTAAELCIYHLFVWSNLNFLHISQWITLPTHSCLASYFFCANLLHSLIMWLIVSSLSMHSQNLLFCCILSLLALIWWFLRRYFVLRFGEILFIIIHSLELLTSAIADGFPLESEWQQVSSSLQDCSLYSGRSQ